MASTPQPKKQATRNENQCSQTPSRSAPFEMTPGSEILLWTSGYVLPPERQDEILPAGQLNAVKKKAPKLLDLTSQ